MRVSWNDYLRSATGFSLESRRWTSCTIKGRPETDRPICIRADIEVGGRKGQREREESGSCSCHTCATCPFETVRWSRPTKLDGRSMCAKGVYHVSKETKAASDQEHCCSRQGMLFLRLFGWIRGALTHYTADGRQWCRRPILDDWRGLQARDRTHISTLYVIWHRL